MDIAHLAQTRYTTKAFDASRRIPDALIEQIKTLLRFSPSSTNAQPWHFFITDNDAGKARIAKATAGAYAFNETKVRHASHLIVFCARATIDESYMRMILEQETADGRFPTSEARDNVNKGRAFFTNMHRFELRDAQHWMEKQVYLALGTLLLGAATLEIDACPIEGFDRAILDAELGLRDMGYTSSVIVAIGYRSAEDFNAKLPKSRFPAKNIFTTI